MEKEEDFKTSVIREGFQGGMGEGKNLSWNRAEK